MKWAMAAMMWLAGAACAAEGPVSHFAFTNFTSESFRRHEPARQPIPADQIDRALLDAAVFHETNRRRREHGLPELRFDAKTVESARIHAEAMARHKFADHENPFDARLRSITDRARAAGLQPSFLAENVASAFARRYAGGGKFYLRKENGRTISSEQPGGPQIPMRSYMEAAEALVDGWMNSPGHRRNILHESARFLGCACEPSPTEREMQKLYCVQVFFAPLR